MGRTVGRLLICLPPALAAGLFFLADSSSGIEPDASVRLTSATSEPQIIVSGETVLPPGILASSEPKYVGAAGCAAMNCHGGDSLESVQGSEHSLWMQKDPHANAYDVLLNAQSKHMIKLLKGSDRYRKMLGDREAHETKLCLDCHSVAPHESRLADGHKFSLRDGVSCEGCHGPAEKWLDPHKRPEWDSYTKETKAAMGFMDTDSLASRARICAQCHIGGDDREVNHDLMAAGHPRLTWEMAAYSDNYPPHWNPNDDRRRHALNAPGQSAADVKSAYDAKLWVVGQLATAEKTVELLKERATNPHKVWPEFTEYGCYACHHNLQPSNWRQDRGFADRRPGTYPWATWQFPVLAELSPHFLPEEANPFLNENNTYEQLRKEMSKPIPARDKVAELAANLQIQLRTLGDAAEGMSFTADEIRSLLEMVSSADGKKLVGKNWDAAAQVYLANVALYQGLVDAEGRISMDGKLSPLTEEDRKLYEHFAAIRKSLKFPTEKMSSGQSAIFNSPKSFEETAPNPVDDIQSQLDGINNAVKP